MFLVGWDLVFWFGWDLVICEWVGLSVFGWVGLVFGWLVVCCDLVIWVGFLRICGWVR